MELSPFLFKLTEIALNTLTNRTNADIRVHGEKNIPNQPVVYVINHFTRMETFFLPYIIYKATGKHVLSLAYHGFFGGGFGRFLEKLGAVSTKSPDRDKIMISALLKGDLPCLIFPEGQMIKDKKIIEKGKYMIYNTGIRRPPHTGAAVLAIRSQFYREKLRFYYENNFQEGIDEYRRFFEIDQEIDIKDIVNQETYIVPVNITYFPIRARNNIINRIAERFVEDVSERLEEELEVEGTMIIDGVDIDINFGEPISLRSYVQKRVFQRKIKNKRLYLKEDIVNRDLRFRNMGINLMHKYMDSIYGMTTVNHDHIFSYLLSKYKKNRINESSFKNRAYLTIEAIRNLHIQSYHSALLKNQEYLLSDDFHDIYEDFIDSAISDGLIIRKNGYIAKRTKRFTRPYKFHTIRKDNIVEVLRNELEPIGNVVRCINRVMKKSSKRIQKTIVDKFLALDRDIFEKDYEKYYIEGESKQKKIGMPFFLKRFFSNNGVLLIHGYMAAPEEIRELANYLYNKGFTVYGVRLRGHGTAPEDLVSRKWGEWYESVNRGYIVLKNSVQKIVIGGFSTGAGLALLQSVNKPGCFKGVVSVSAPMKLQNIASYLVPAVVFWNKFLGKMNIGKGTMEFVSNWPENPSINYYRNPVKGVRELGRFMKVVEDKLSGMYSPALVIQGSKDQVVNPESGLEVFEKIGTLDKELFRVYSERHGILRGEGSVRIFQRIEQFLQEIFSRR